MNDQYTQSKYILSLSTGVLSACVLHPIDALRIRCFLGSNVGNFRSLKNGLMFNVWSSGIKHIISYPIREELNISVNQYLLYSPFKTELIASALSSILLTTISTPINLVKVRTQNCQVTSFTTVLNDVYKTKGIKGFYQGGNITLIRDMCWNVVYFPLFGFINEKIEPSILNRSLVSVFSSVIATTVSYPFDGVRLFRQSSNERDLIKCFKKSINLHQSNVRSYICAIIRVSLATCLSHVSYLYLTDS